MSKKISVIIPVYNASKYLPTCLASVSEQRCENMEILCINDGSTDDSLNIIYSFQKKDARIVLINQKNQGVSAARNAGLNIARGEYVLFVDADDLLFPHAVCNAYHYATSNDLDLLYGKINYIDANGQILGEFVMDSEEVRVEDGFKHQRRGFIVGLYRRKTLGNLRFIPDVPIAEDAVFNLLMHAKAKRISYFNQSFYQYRKTSGSALNSDTAKSEKAFRGFIKIIDEIYGYLRQEEVHLTQTQYEYFNRPLFLTSKMALEANIIPNFSKKRYGELVKRIQKTENKKVIKNLKNSFPLYGFSWSVFICYHLFRKHKNALIWKLFKSQ